MAGHSKFKNIMHRKGAQDAKRAKFFTKLGREIAVASKLGGPDPDANPRLRAAIVAARGMNMPKDRIEKAIAKGSGGGEQENYDEIRYEGYGPGNIALIVEALTDNKNRTVAEVRSAFSKHGGNMGETGSVSFGFTRCGYISYPAGTADADPFFEAALEAGADDVESSDESHDVYCASEDFSNVSKALESAYGEPVEAKLIWKPNNRLDIALDPARTLFKLIDALEDNDDVQTVTGNFEVSDGVMEQLAGEG